MRLKVVLQALAISFWSHLRLAACARLGNFDSHGPTERRGQTINGTIEKFPPCVDMPESESSESEYVISFYVQGDTPYSVKERYCLNDQLRNLSLRNKSKKQDDPAFIMHVGDIKSGLQGECDDDAYADIARMFTHPVNAIGYDPEDCFFIPGDNEWTNCEDSASAWQLWIKHFGPNNEHGFGELSDGSVPVDRQSDKERQPGVSRTENFAFFKDNVLFIGLNMVIGGEIGDDFVRFSQNFEWARERLLYYSTQDMKAAVIFGHSYVKTNGYLGKRFGRPLRELLKDEYPDLPVLYAHGDLHQYCVREPDAENPNLYSVGVDNGEDSPPLLVTVLRNPNDGTHFFSIDQRGGLYSPWGNCPQIAEVTWSADRVVTPGIPALAEVALESPGPAYPLGICRGNCKDDSDCLDGLVCLKRVAKEPVPGCLGGGRKGSDYCYLPPDSSPPPSPVPTASPTSTPVTPSPTTAPTSVPTIVPTSMASPPPRDPDTPSPTISPTSTVASPPPSEPETVLSVVADNPPDPAYPLRACQGDCDRNTHCQPGLLCFRREGLEPVPGCLGEGEFARDFCFDPSIVTPPSPTTSPTDTVSSPPPREPETPAPSPRSVVSPTPPPFTPDTYPSYCDRPVKPGKKCFRFVFENSYTGKIVGKTARCIDDADEANFNMRGQDLTVDISCADTFDGGIGKKGDPGPKSFLRVSEYEINHNDYCCFGPQQGSDKNIVYKNSNSSDSDTVEKENEKKKKKTTPVKKKKFTNKQRKRRKKKKKKNLQ